MYKARCKTSVAPFLLYGIFSHNMYVMHPWHQQNSLGCGGIHTSPSIGVLKTQCKEALNLIRVVAHLKWGGDRDTLLDDCSFKARLRMYCVWHSSKCQSTTTGQHPQCWSKTGTWSVLHTSPVSSMYKEANKTPLEERRLKLSMHYYLKTCACTDNPAHHALHEFDLTIRDLYLSKPNGKGGMTLPPTQPVGLKVEEALTSAEIDAEMVCPLKMPSFTPGTHEYDPERHSLIEGVSKFMVTREEARAKFNEYHNALRPRWSLH